MMVWPLIWRTFSKIRCALKYLTYIGNILQLEDGYYLSRIRIDCTYRVQDTFCSNSRTNCLEKHEKINSRRCVHRFCTQNPCARKNDTRKKIVYDPPTIKSGIKSNSRFKNLVFFSSYRRKWCLRASFYVKKKNGVSLFICSKNFLICYTLLLFNSRQWLMT